MSNKKISFVGKIYLVAYLFLFLFAPPFLRGVNFAIPLGGYSLITLMAKYRKDALLLLFDKKHRKARALIGAYIGVFVFSWGLSCLFGDGDVIGNGLINLYSLFLNFAVTFVCATYLVLYCAKRGVDSVEIIKYIVYAGVVQLVFALVTLIAPGFRQWTIELMMKDTNENLLMSTWVTERRFYGFANNLLDLFGFGVGIIAILPLFYATLRKKRLFILWSPVLLILAILNSRTGIVIYGLGLVCWLVGIMVSKKISIAKLLLTILAIIVGVCGCYFVVNEYSPNTISWIRRDMLSFFDDETSGTATIIKSGDFWSMPKGVDLAFGAGHNISAYSSYKTSDDVHSDNGYVNELWKVGIVGLLIYGLLNYYLLKTISNNNDGRFRTLCVFFGLSMIVFLVKGSLIGYNPGNVIIYTLFLFAINEHATNCDNMRLK